jgi:hypothetical protein
VTSSSLDNLNILMKKIDIRSLLLGLALGFCFLFALGADRGEKPNQVSPATYHRFEGFGTQSTAYLVDTATGQVWASGEAAFSSEKVKIPRF